MRCIIGLLFSLCLISSFAIAQGDPTHLATWTFTEIRNTGCPDPVTSLVPRFDPNTFPLCWMPPGRCPPLAAYAPAQSQITINWDQLPPAALCILLASSVFEPQYTVSPCVAPYLNVMAAGLSNVSGRINFTWNLPDYTPPALDMTQPLTSVAVMQVVCLDSTGWVGATSNVVDVSVN